jgi:hypothetical protein
MVSSPATQRYTTLNRKRGYRVRVAIVTLLAWLFSVVLTSAHAAMMTAAALGGSMSMGAVTEAPVQVEAATLVGHKSEPKSAPNSTAPSAAAAVPCHESSPVVVSVPSSTTDNYGVHVSHETLAADSATPASNVCKQHCALDHQSLDTPTSKPPFHAVFAVLTVENAPSMGVFAAKVVEMPISWASSPIYLTSARLRP